MESTIKNRIESIDILRGIVMVIMALDHVRDYFHIAANLDNPLNLATTTPALFFTRWITHFCAPVFVFLSGISIYLQSQSKTKNELAVFLIKRGLWLIFIEWIVVAFAWTFNPLYQIIPFAIIWTIGISMVILGLLLLIRLHYNIILLLGIIIVFGHNLLDIKESAESFQSNFWWDLLHHGAFARYEFADNHFAFLIYPFLPWTGVMMLGYCAGIFFTQNFSFEQRKRLLIRTGITLIIFFVGLRFTNLYGDTVNWKEQKDLLLTFFSFINVNKYPPSLLYVCIMIGPALLFLAFIEKVKNKFTDVMLVFGRTALFYYILHLYLIHSLATIFFFARGHSFQDAGNVGKQFPFLFVAPGEGYGLFVVYCVWLTVVVALYPLCKWYNNYKIIHREKWWLSYL